MDVLTDSHLWAALLTLTALEIVLGVDNLIFVSLLAARAPAAQQALVRRVGVSLALGARLVLLFAVTWIMRLNVPLFGVAGHAFSGRDLVLIGGGLFLLYKSTIEIHARIDGEGETHVRKPAAGALAVVLQIALLDIVFSIDSVITAVGMANELWVMAVAMVIAVAVMLVASGAVMAFIERFPTVRILALSFLLLIGATLVADGFGAEVPKATIYVAVAFSAMVELLNQLASRRRQTRRPRERQLAKNPPVA